MRRNNVAARTEFTAADIAEFWAAIEDLQQRVATLERLVETLVTAKLDQTEVNGEIRRRLAKMETLLQALANDNHTRAS